MLDQDTGGGIRASGRCDIYMGIGDEAEQLAGKELATGKLYYLAIRPELMGAPAK
jgi:membrane-bound lytic murein transglycosylase A